MKTLFIFIFIVSSSKYINAQFGDDQNRWESSEQKLLKFESKDERPQQHNFFSSRYNDLHHNDNAQNYYNLHDGNFNGGFGKQYSTGVNTESYISSALPTRLELQSRLIGFNRNNQKSAVSIGPDEPHTKYNSYGTQKRLNITDYNIFNSKSTIKYQTKSSTNKNVKAASDQNSTYKNITILILDESNKILNQLSVPMLNTSHIIIKAFSNDLQSEKITSNEKTSQGPVSTTNEQKTIPSAFGKLTYSSTYSYLLDHSETLSSTPPSPLKNSSGDIIKTIERNLIIDSNSKYPKHFIPLNNHNNEVVINNKNKAGEEQFNYFRATLPEAIENHSERMSSTTVHSVGMNTNGVKTTMEQQASTSSISLHRQQISGTDLNGHAGVKLGSQSSIEPTILKMIGGFTEQNTFPNTQSSKWNSENITNVSNQNNIDLTTETPVDFFYVTGTNKEAVIINKSPPGGQDLHLSLKPARLEIIEENTDRTKNVSSKNHFVNVFVPTLEFTEPKNNSMKANDQYNALEDKTKTSGKFKFLQIDSSTQNEKISSMPIQNTELEIKSSRPEGMNQNLKKGLGHSEANDIFSQFVSVGSKVTVPEISSVTLKFPTSISSINQLQSSPSSLEEETNILMDILLGQQSESTIASYNKYSTMTTTEHHLNQV
ncbi:uncharacterized protein LOC111055453 [Nilaparvata lugens]|uniref:uncharacterized protein LOC111055453 n=1 Tax=Nilaparvata lugens TaxID=108931 RepID=UPI00193DDFC0|nr:uncharacterized protein LOC111055453 [Nilaparvata lugens]